MKRTPKSAFYCSLIIWGSVYCISADAKGNEISDLTITQATLEGVTSCLHYKITGICFWLDCSSGTCNVITTNKVEHLLPDTVVSVCRGNGMNPWQYANTIVDPLAYQLGQAQVKCITGFDMGYGDANTNSVHDTDTHFKEVDVIGNPAISIFTSHDKIFLPSQAKPYQPYYLSMQDALAWRSSLTEMFYPASFTPGLHEMGSFPFNDWGPIYPRTGFMNQPNDAKAAALAAQRAADIATRSGQPHLYLPLDSSCGDHCHATEVKENDSKTQWQMVYPYLQTQCVIFGANDVLNPTPWGSDAAEKGHGNYVWLLWRDYQGCIPAPGAKYIGETDFK